MLPLGLLHASIIGCTDDFDCSLAGKCTQGVCVCQRWVKGSDCAALNLAPLASADSLRSVVTPVGNATRWGGSVVADGGRWHLFAAEMSPLGCGLGVWTAKSRVLHAVGSSSAGPFERVGLAVGTEAHNPVVSRASDGTWLLWTCGCPLTPTTPGCAKEEATCPGGAAAQWTTTVYSAASLDGPWTAHVDVLGNITRGRLGSQNVAPVMGDDGSVHLMFKGPDNNTEASIAVAPHWRGPYTLLATNVFAEYFAANITNEDCYLWRARDGTWHALTHRMSPSDRTGFVSGGHAFATSLADWRYASTPAYTDAVAVAAGPQLTVHRRERPQLAFGDDGLPAVLLNGIVPPTGNPFTFAQRLI